MATFKVVRDNRYNRKDNSNRYCLRAIVNGKVYYHQLDIELTDQEHKLAFEKNSLAKKWIDIREKCKAEEIKAERIYSTMKRWDPKRFKMLFYGNIENIPVKEDSLPETLALKELTEYYLENTGIKRSSKVHFKCSMSIIEQFYPGVYIDDIDSKFLKRFESHLIEKRKSVATVASYMRNLRTLVNYFMHIKKIIPPDYEYPFGKGGHSIKSVRKKKRVMMEEEIQKVIDLDEFESQKEEYARNIWLTLYNANGINPIDLLRMRWDDFKSDYIPVFRMKTESTLKYTLLEIPVPLTEELKYYLNKVGDPTSPFVLGKIKEGYTDVALRNRKNRFRQEINAELKKLSKRLNLSVPLKMATARDCYAMTNKRNKVSTDFTSDMLGHSDIRTTLNYLDSLSVDESFEVNNRLLKRKSGDKKDKKDQGLETEG